MFKSSQISNPEFEMKPSHIWPLWVAASAATFKDQKTRALAPDGLSRLDVLPFMGRLHFKLSLSAGATNTQILMFPANRRWTVSSSLGFLIFVRDQHSARRKIRVRNIDEHDVCRFRLGPRFFRQNFRDALDNFTFLIDRAPRQP